MELKDLPIIYKILQREKLTPESTIENDKLICTDSKGDKYLIKDCRGIEEIIYTEVFPAIKSMNLKFEILELPEYLKVTNGLAQEETRGKKFIIMQFYDGTSFNQLWNEGSAEGYGGRAIDVTLSEKIISLLQDFSLIDITKLSEFSLIAFDLNKWRTHNFPVKAKHFIEHGILTQAQLDQGLAILNSPMLFQNSKMIFTNGDFYPRNFIELSARKIVVIDWEGRTDYEVMVTVDGKEEKLTSQRNILINYIENHLAFFFVHMWGNYSIQKMVLKNAAKKFDLSIENLQAALIIKSLEQAHHFSRGFLAVRQAEIYINALNKQYIEDLLS